MIAPLSGRQLTALVDQTRRSQDVLLRRIEQARIARDSHSIWGQFLDDAREHDQAGIFGTTAAIEILVSAGADTASQHVKEAQTALPIVGDGTLAWDDSDTALVFKAAAIVSAVSALDAAVDSTHPAVSHLLGMMADGRGWGHYAGVVNRDTSPALVPTAFALYALRRVRDWRADLRCTGVLTWLAQRMTAGDTDAVQDALGLLALNTYSSPGVDIPAWRDGQTHAQQRVELMVRQEKSHPEVVPYHYAVAVGADESRQNCYMFFIPAVIGGLALLSGRQDEPIHGARQVSALVHTVAQAVQREDGFRNSGGRLATVDQLWVYSLLGRYVAEAQDPLRLLPPIVGPALTGRSQLLVSVLLLLVALVTAVFAADASVALGVRAALGVIASACTAILVAINVSVRTA